jgi:hypothetical protein
MGAACTDLQRQTNLLKNRDNRREMIRGAF